MEKSKAHFPLFVDLSEKQILVAGGGNIAARRVHILCSFCNKIKVVAPEICGEIKSEPVQYEERIFMAGDLDGMDLVLAATNDVLVDQEIYSLCKKMKIPVNVASDRQKCDFFFPGIVQDENVVVGITASGKNHTQARLVREKIQKVIGNL